MRGLGGVGVRSFRRAFGRWALTAVGVVLGVAVLFAVQAANTSASRSVERRFGRVNRATVAITSPVRAIPAAAIDTAASLDGVELVSTYATVDVRLPGHERDGEPWRSPLWSSRQRQGPEHQDEPRDVVKFSVEGDNPADDAMEVSMGNGIARDLGVAIGDVIVLEAPAGRFELQVVQLVFRDDGEPVHSGLATSPATAERLGGERITETATVQLSPGVDPDDWIERHRGAFTGGVLLSSAGFDVESFREFVRAMNNGFAVGALTAVFIGAFLIFLTMSLQVGERTATYGMLRALGSTRAQVARVVVAEAVALGVVATAAGLAVGAVLAAGLTRLVARLYEIEAPEIVFPLSALVLSSAVGIVVTVLGAALPAWRASNLSPSSAMRPGPTEAPRARRLAIVGAIVAIAATITGFLRPPRGNDPTLLVLLAGVIVALPLVSGPLAAVVGRLTARLVPGVGRIGVLHLRTEPRRSGYAMGLVMVVLAVVFSLGNVRHTFESAVDRIVSRTLAADLFVHASGGLKAEDIDRLEDLPEVEGVTSFRWIAAGMGVGAQRQPAQVIAIDPVTYFEVLGLPLLGTVESDVQSRLASDDIVAVITETDARELGLDEGDMLRVDGPDGAVQVEVVGRILNLDGSYHAVLMADHVVERIFGAGAANGVRLSASPRIDAPRLQAAVEEALGDRPDLFVRTGSDERADAHRFNQQFFSIFQAMTLVALLVGLLGLANTAAFALLRRTRELGVLRAVGTTRRQVMAMVAIETLTLAGAASALAVPLGLAMSALIVKSVSGEMGATVVLRIAWPMIPAVIAVAVVLSIVASLVPARRAARLDPVVALRFE